MDRSIDRTDSLPAVADGAGDHDLDDDLGTDDSGTETFRWPGTDRPGWTAWEHLQPSGRWLGRPAAAGPAAGVAYAELGLRAAAFAIDVAVMFLVTSLIQQVTSNTLAPLISQSTDILTWLLVAEALASGLVVLALAYATAILRATPGQLAVGLTTLRADDGRALPFGAALRRQALLFGPVALLPFAGTLTEWLIQATATQIEPPGVGAASSFLSTWPVWIGPLVGVWLVVLGLSAFADPRGRGLHDRAAGSAVVREV